jgi:RNA polymerase sigma-70 factor (ECF subfamily)
VHQYSAAGARDFRLCFGTCDFWKGEEVTFDIRPCRGQKPPAVDFDNPAFLERLRSGDDVAVRQLVRRYHGALIATATAIIGSRAQAEEVVQETWLAVIAKIGSFERRSSLATWLFAIAANRARTRATREGRMVAFVPAESGDERPVDPWGRPTDSRSTASPWLCYDPDPEHELGVRQLWIIAEEAINQLSPNQKDVLMLRVIEGLSAEDTCAFLDVSAQNQRVLLHRARSQVQRRMRAALGSDCPAGALV